MTDNVQLFHVINMINESFWGARRWPKGHKLFANSPDVSQAIIDAIIDAFEAQTTMSKQALNSVKVREGLKDVLLGPGQL